MYLGNIPEKIVKPQSVFFRSQLISMYCRQLISLYYSDIFSNT